MRIIDFSGGKKSPTENSPWRFFEVQEKSSRAVTIVKEKGKFVTYHVRNKEQSVLFLFVL